ncbi:MAG: UvrD-helicase domain-containing protein, partial [bacterium]|nr:UvrD-helicase domain-containing protein [bacterium]
MQTPDQKKILSDLNDRQREAVTTLTGPVLVIAGPGSGKTKALTHRIAYLMTSGVPTAGILAVTFTNRAAQEMRERVAKLLLGDDQSDETDQGDKVATERLHRAQRFTELRRGRSSSSISSGLPFIGTFHSFAASLLRREAGAIGYRREFTIYDEDDRMALLKEVMKELAIPKHISATAAGAIISDLKADLIAGDEYEGKNSADPFERAIGRIYEAYQERLHFSNVLDFDDLIFFAVRVLRDNPAARKRWQQRFGHLCVDEYQDTSMSQYELIRLLAEKHRNLFVIGDDSQAIYGWRHADYRNILNFEHDWPEAKVVLLEENYRSTPEIVAAANHLIAQNQDQKPKSLWTKNPPGSHPAVSAHESGRAEAEFIAGEAATLHASGYAWRDMALLYRTNAQSRALEEALLEHGIPYTIIGGIRFFSRREIKDLIAYLRYLLKPDDALALNRIVNVPPRGIGPKTLLAYL